MKTQKEFLEALRAERNGWVSMQDGSIRRGKPRYRYCPVTAVVKTMTGKRWSVTRPIDAGKTIGLPIETIQKIVRAADSARDRGGYPRVLHLRKRMLVALGLEEK